MITFYIGYLLAYLIIFSGFSKLLKLKEFRQQLVGFDFLPALLTGPVSWLIPLLELSFGIALFMNPSGIMPASLVGGLFVFFTVFVAWALKSGRKTACFCFGENDGVISNITLIRNLLLLALSGISIILMPRVFEVPTTSSRIILAVYGLCTVPLFFAGFKLIEWRKEGSIT